MVKAEKNKFYKNPKDYKILLVYPNIQQCAMMPYSMGLFTALLREVGYQVELFDSTFYMNDLTANYESYQTAVKEFDWAEKGVQFNRNDMLKDFNQIIENFSPDLIAVSVVENTYPIGRELIRSIPKRHNHIPVIWGGVFATFAPEWILRDSVGDYVCRGEGENALLEFCRRACNGEPLYNIPNLWVNNDGNIIKNTMGPKVNIDNLPFPDYDLFEEQAIYRPMQGKIWRTMGIESQRGCPFTCTYCNSPSQNVLSKHEQGHRFYRKKNIQRVREELDYLNKKYNIELVYWLTDTFLAVTDREFDELVEMYSDFKIPFWMNTRSETMTEHRADGLEKMNMLRMNFGIEHGNPKYRLNMLKRRVTNEVMLNSFHFCSDKNYTTTGNCIIGMPEENRKLIFDTIEFCRQLPESMENTGAFIFAPYHGTPLRDIAVEKGYLDPNTVCDIQNTTMSMLDQPQLRRKEVLGLARTFGLYQVLPKSEWKWIEKAEHDTQEGRDLFDKLQRDYHVKNAAARLDEG
jgi:anaerobic magnesium-protoporphyrin IX monomethyl ester cyclase